LTLKMQHYEGFSLPIKLAHERCHDFWLARCNTAKDSPRKWPTQQAHQHHHNLTTIMSIIEYSTHSIPKLSGTKLVTITSSSSSYHRHHTTITLSYYDQHYHCRQHTSIQPPYQTDNTNSIRNIGWGRRHMAEGLQIAIVQAFSKPKRLPHPLRV